MGEFQRAEGVAIVTGAAGGMGSHCARLLGEDGWDELILCDLDEARLFSCGISWAPQGTKKRRALEGVDLHDRGGRVRFRTPDSREFLLELHGRDWPLSEGRESLVLILTDPKSDETVGSSWTSLGAAQVGLDLGWLAIDCAPVVSETGEQRS